VLRALGETPLSLAVVAASGWLASREAACVGVGDVVVVDGLRRQGACVLAAADASYGIAVERVDESVRIGARRVGLAAEPTSFEREPMSSGSGTEATVEIAAIEDGGPLVEALADAPVLVRAEVGTVTLPAREWAALGVGDVVALDRRVGDAVHLRVGGRTVARGELVDVDGALGVRVIERIP
jgi:flagellar motor switch/type III secretory pathway protein FliN